MIILCALNCLCFLICLTKLKHSKIPDFTGDQCKESNNDCDGYVCSGGAVTVDGLSICHCECPIENRMTGPNCDKGMYCWHMYSLQNDS